MKKIFYLSVAVLMTFFLGSSLAFFPLPVQAARLFGVTGDGASTPETLFELNQTNATSTEIMALGNGDDGETIAFNQDDGLLYHLSGQGDYNANIIFESVDPDTLVITKIPLSGDNFINGYAATYNPSTGKFLVANFLGNLYTLTTGGIVNSIGSLDHLSKGLAFADEKLYSIEKRWDSGVHRLFQINPDTGETIDSVVITLVGFTIDRANGLATHPDTGELWGLLNDGGFPGKRRLTTINQSTGVATDIGLTGDAFAGIAFITLLNTSPVADAGPEQTVECTSHYGAPVTLDGTGSFDPDNDPIVSYSWTDPFETATDATPTAIMQLGISNVNLIVNDGTVDSEPDTVIIRIVDTTAPKVRAKLKKKKKSWFRVKFSATDICDADLKKVDAFLNGVRVTNGQVVKLIQEDGSSDDDSSDDGKKKIRRKRHHGDDGNSNSCSNLKLTGHSFTLEVTATDNSGNVGTKSDTFVFPPKHRDDCSSDDMKLKKKLKKLKKKWRKRYSDSKKSNAYSRWKKWRKK